MNKRRNVSGKKPNLLWLRGQIKEMIQDQLGLNRQYGEGSPPFPPPTPFGFPNSEQPPQRRPQPLPQWEGPPPQDYGAPYPYPPSMQRRQSPRSNNQPTPPPPGPPMWNGPGYGMMDGPPPMPPQPPRHQQMRPNPESPMHPRRTDPFGPPGPPPVQGNISPYHDPMMPPAPWRGESPQQINENRSRNQNLSSPYREWEEMPESFDETLVVDSRRPRIRRKR
ncbi:hypothetical protein [Hazenella coriacea]|uniref:Uncharacterized protein n=1 Tax=Hazenella coriacea TaxID=1179467 RepID=A0A4R3L2M1_9BACL|nr:hypothetical protein [Hazenella coriacea]TCS93098.1 hypothetical protein EDD58_10939 [Hazenella coriacea]